MKVREIMTKEVGTATLDSTIEDVAAMMKEEDVGAIPVVDDGELAGIVTDRDIVIRCIAGGRPPPIPRLRRFSPKSCTLSNRKPM